MELVFLSRFLASLVVERIMRINLSLHINSDMYIIVNITVTHWYYFDSVFLSVNPG